MIQILSLREVERKGKKKLSDRQHFSRGWRANSVQELFENLDKFVDQIPEKERWNIYYTACVCEEKSGRVFVEQDVLPFDIDGIDTSKIDDYIQVVSKVVRVKPENMGIVFSGNGLQFIVGMDEPIRNVKYFDEKRHHYKALCGRINSKLFSEGLIGEADTSVFSASRLLRMPKTKNIKKDKGEKEAQLINANIKKFNFKIEDLSGLEDLQKEDQIHPQAYIRMPEPDTEAVCNGCEFLKYCKGNQEKVSEPQWYAMLSIVGRLSDGHKLAHKYSEEYGGYDADETDEKLDQALNASGPRTCQNIESLWDGCKQCAHYRKIKSPILIRGKNQIRTKSTGFWNLVETKDGNVKPSSPNYDDLVRYYDLLHEHRTIRETGLIYRWSGKFWELQEKADIHSFVEESMDPKPLSRHCEEFDKKLRRTKLKDERWLKESDKINLSNGVYDIESGEFLPHDKTYGFPYVLPYDYDRNAKCPKWEKFIEEVTLNRTELINVIQEFMGYCLSYTDPMYGQKAMVLFGSGANGKSVVLQILKYLVGEDNFSAVNLGEAINKDEQRTMLISKMVNITEETPRRALMDSTMFKDLVSGGTIPVRKLYHGSFQMKNMAKIVMACNEPPMLTDTSEGTRRRLLTIPFDVYIKKNDRDPFIINKLKEEISGIFNWALKGLVRLKKNNYMFSEGITIQRTLHLIEDNASPIIEFCEDCLVVDENNEEMGELNSKEFYEYYLDYFGLKGRPINRKRFTSHLIKYVERRVGKKINTEVKKVNGRPKRVLPYVSLREGMDATAY